MGWKQAAQRIPLSPVFCLPVRSGAGPAAEEVSTITTGIRRLLLTSVVAASVAASLPGIVMAAAGGSPDTVVPYASPYGNRSDGELSALAASWDSLDQHQRRALLTEMQRRMVASGGRKGVIRIRTERRYGRIVRQSDGRVIRIEAQVVHVRPLVAEDLGQGRQGFGVGFERRVAGRREVAPSNSEGGVGAGADAPTLHEIVNALQPSPIVPGGDGYAPEPPSIFRVSDPGP